MSKPMKEELKRYYEAQELTQERRQQLQQLQKIAANREGSKTSRWLQWFRYVSGGLFNKQSLQGNETSLHRSPVYSYAMAFMVVAVAWLLVPGGQLDTIEEQVAEEIAYNHNKHMDMEVLTPELEKIQAHLKKLDFSMVFSERLPKANWTLVGGRYCSIQGKLAAQLRLRSSEDDKTYTLYQAIIPTDATATLNGYSSYVQGVSIQLWYENGILLGLAGSH